MRDINKLEHTDDQVAAALWRLAHEDVDGLIEARRRYGESWKQEGGFSAWFNVKRKIDRLVRLCSRAPEMADTPAGAAPIVRERYDIFSQIEFDLRDGDEGTLDAVRDLRRYLQLVEADLILRRVDLPQQRDTKAARERRAAHRDATGQESVRGFVQSTTATEQLLQNGEAS